MPVKPPRVAVRAVILHEEKLLLVNAWPAGRSTLLCAPGGGVEAGASLPENLIREVFEETGLNIKVVGPCMVNEFHDPKSGFHQIEIFFRCTLLGKSDVDPNWQDPENIVSQHVWARADDMKTLHVKPDSLARLAFGQGHVATYDPLEEIVL